MKKRLHTRFPAVRIKKIMQADEDVGKIAMAVPLLVSKALELFLQDLCENTYDITLKRGAKTMNSFHLKQCIQSCNVFDFLKDVVSRVPDLGGAASTTKRRKVAEEDDTDDDIKRSNMQGAPHTNGSGRGRGRGRGRGHGKCGRKVEGESNGQCDILENPADVSHQKDEKQNVERLHNIVEQTVTQNVSTAKNPRFPLRNFDLNVDLNESTDPAAILPEASLSPTNVPETKHEEYLGWSLFEIEKMAIDHMQLAKLNRSLDEEDYDEEDS